MHKEALKAKSAERPSKSLTSCLRDWCFLAPAVVADVSVKTKPYMHNGEKNTQNSHIYRYLVQFEVI